MAPDPEKKPASRKRFKLLTDLSYKDERHEAGEVVSNIPAESIPWLIEDGLIEPAPAKGAD